MHIRNIQLLKGHIPDLDPAHMAHIYFNTDNGTLFVLQPARKEKRFDTYWLTSLEIAVGHAIKEKNKQLSLFSLPLPPNRFEHTAHKKFKSKITLRFKKTRSENQITFISESNTIAAIMVFMRYFEYSTQPYFWLIRNPHSPVAIN